LREQIVAAIRENILSIEQAFALATRNPARVLKLHDTGEIAQGKRADLLMLDASTFEVRGVWAGGVAAH
jgi:alpha-D-ribose 1-methylphosphonate 5-triphosphate diphosphatase